MRCRSCGRESREGFRFCGWCGEPLAGIELEERKTVSAVFCDLVGYTSRTEGWDPEDVKRLVSDYFAGVLPEFERFGGTLLREFGDGLLIVYGWPRSHEDDPERAVRAALASLTAVDRLNASRPDLDLHVHIGVTTGETLVHLDEGASSGRLWGASLATASRLEDAATADEILVDDATYRATAHAIEYRAVEPVLAKGLSAPVVAWRPIAPRSRRGLELGDAAVPPLFGRAAELGLVLSALDRSLNGAGPQLVTLVGSAGIGKSRLVFELFRAIEAGHELINWRHGRSPPFPAETTFWALGEIVKRQAGMLDTDDAAAAEAKLAQAVRELVGASPERDRIERHLRALVGLSGAADSGREGREAAFAAWRHFIEALARKRPLVLAFEDLHWAGDGLLDFIEHLHEWVRELPLLIVCTARPQLASRCREWGARADATTIELEPLAHGDGGALVASLPGAGEMSPGMRQRIVAKAAGNPLYAVELVRMLAARERTDADDHDEELPLPPTVRAIISTRLDTLSLEDKQLLQIGSVIGRAVWPSALAAVAGRSSARVSDRLRALELDGFLTQGPRSSVAGEPEYRFDHELIRDAAYAGIPRSERMAFHRQLAEWTELLSPDRSGDRAEMLAHHYKCAYELARATGADSAPLATAARHALRAAGDRAVALQDFPAAERHFRRALALWPTDDPERPYLLLRLGKSVYRASTRGAEVLAGAAAELQAIGDPGAAAEAETFLAYLAHHDGRRAELEAHLDRAVALVRDSGPSASKAEVLVDVANMRSMARQHEQTVAAAEEAIAIADQLKLPELMAHALSSIGISRGLAGDLRGRTDLQRAVAVLEEIDSHLSAHCLGMLADLEGQLGDLSSCFSLQARARARALEAGHAGFVRWLAAERVGEGYWTGAWDEAVATADRFVADAEAGSAHFMLGYCRTIRGRMRLARGDPAGARDDAAHALEFARGAEDLQMLYPALAFCARAEAEAGTPEAGAEVAGELLDLWQAKLDLYPVSSWAADLACALHALGRSAALLAVTERVRTRTRWLDAVVAFAGGDFAAAAEHFHGIGSRPDEAVARLRAAATLRSGQKRRAEAQLEQALAFFRDVGADARLREAAAVRAAFVPGLAQP
jgi:class 3 adenylate cyclase